MTHFNPNDPPQVFGKARLREKGRRRGRITRPSTAHKVQLTDRAADGWAIGRTAVVVALVALFLAGCSNEENSSRLAHKTSSDHLGIDRPGSQLFKCNDGSMVGIDVLPGNLSLDLRQPADGPAERLTAEAVGMPYAGKTVSIAHSHDTIAIMRAGKPVEICQRTLAAPTVATSPTALMTGPTRREVRKAQ